MPFMTIMPRREIRLRMRDGAWTVDLLGGSAEFFLTFGTVAPGTEESCEKACRFCDWLNEQLVTQKAAEARSITLSAIQKASGRG